jgi:anaerobic magnesium-protoporphyrin IX monomethyl ester cyclase
MKVLFVFPNIDTGGYKPLGISVLSAIAKQKGWDAELFDTSFYDVNELSSNEKFKGMKEAAEQSLSVMSVDISDFGVTEEVADVKGLMAQKVEEFDPDLIAVSIFSQEFHLGMTLLEVARSVKPKVATCVGGVHCIADPESVAKNKHVDFVCFGEGEEAFKTILDQVESGHIDPAFVPANCYIENGEVKKTPIGEYAVLDDLPYLDNDIFDDRQMIRVFDGEVYRSIDVCITRGCFERCVYCLFAKQTSEQGGALRKYSITRFIDELEYTVKRHNIGFIRFQDSTFLNLSNAFLKEFSEEYIKRVNLPFVIDTTPQQVNEEKCGYLKAMGCRSMSIGIETGNEKNRNEYLNKRAKDKHILNAFNCGNGAGIRTVSFILLGFPFETHENIFETVRLIRKAQVSSPAVGFVYPFVGSELRNMALEAGLFEVSSEKNGTPQYVRDCPAISNPNLTDDEYRGIYRTFPFYCKFPEEYWEYVKVAERFDEEGNLRYEMCKNFYERFELHNSYMMKPVGNFLDLATELVEAS